MPTIKIQQIHQLVSPTPHQVESFLRERGYEHTDSSASGFINFWKKRSPLGVVLVPQDQSNPGFAATMETALYNISVIERMTTIDVYTSLIGEK